jgi:hypothetical protein
MVNRHLPSIEALTSNDDELLRAELRLSEVCAELAVARAFLDHVERMVGCRAREGAANDADLPAASRALG